MADKQAQLREEHLNALAIATSLPPPSSSVYGLHPRASSVPLPSSLASTPLSLSLTLHNLRRPAPSHPLLYAPLCRSMISTSLSSLSSRLLPSPPLLSSLSAQAEAHSQAVLSALCSAFDAAVHLLSLLPDSFPRLPLPLPPVAPIPSLPRHSAFAAIIPGDSVAEVVLSTSLLNFLNIYNTLLFVRIILTWFPNAPQAVVSPLATICDPYLNVFRGIIPPLGGTLDFSPLLAFLMLNVFTSTAAALPAELPEELRRGEEEEERK